RILTTALPENIGQFADLLAEIRTELRTRLDTHEQRGAALKQLVTQENIEAFAAEGEPALRAKLEAILNSA
ncbi:MAG: hypothetical protein QGG25_19250, partial [Phycisphaerae bacterium]|nr:hypothetical protein [Phycisphaerae bacterium]